MLGGTAAWAFNRAIKSGYVYTGLILYISKHYYLADYNDGSHITVCSADVWLLS